MPTEPRFNAVPVIVQQTVETMIDKNTPANIKFNNSQVIRNIRDYCDLALQQYEKQSKKNFK